MASVYDEIEIEDMEYNESDQIYYYPCPCGDRFYIPLEDLHDGEDIASCPSCSLTIRIIFDEVRCNQFYLVSNRVNTYFHSDFN